LASSNGAAAAQPAAGSINEVGGDVSPLSLPSRFERINAMTNEQLAQRALMIQDACNPSGVAHTLAETICQLRANGVVGTEELCSHPIVQLMAHKMADLCNMATMDTERYWDAYSACNAMSLAPVLA